MLDSKLTGQIYSTDIADIVTNALKNCPDSMEERAYPHLTGTNYKRLRMDRECRCAIYQEMLELYQYY